MSAPNEASQPAAGEGSDHANIHYPTSSPENGEGSSTQGMTNSQGWDGKLRVPKNALMSNPEALSDPEYSDDENVLPGEVIAADEGMLNIKATGIQKPSVTKLTCCNRHSCI